MLPSCSILSYFRFGNYSFSFSSVSSLSLSLSHFLKVIICPTSALENVTMNLFWGIAHCGFFHDSWLNGILSDGASYSIPTCFFPLRLVYYTFFPPDFVVLFLDPSSHKMCWSVSSHWSSCYGFKYDVGYPYLFYFHHGNNWVHNFSFVLFFFFFLPLKLTETPFNLSVISSGWSENDGTPLPRSFFLRNAIVIIIKNAVLSLFICLSLSLSSTQIYYFFPFIYESAI